MRKVSICLSVALLLFTLTACGKTLAEEIQDIDGTPTQVATQQPEEPSISKETGQPNDPALQDISVSVAEAGGGHTLELEKTDAETISQILSADSWVADSTDCLSDYIVTLDGRTIYYHSDCGTFNERLEQSHQSLHLSETDRATVNDIIRAVISNEPGSARPVTIYFAGHIYSHDGYITYDLPDGFDFIGETNNVGNSPKIENFAANEDGYLYKSIENDELIYFQWKEWDESVDGGKEPYLL